MNILAGSDPIGPLLGTWGLLGVFVFGLIVGCICVLALVAHWDGRNDAVDKADAAAVSPVLAEPQRTCLHCQKLLTPSTTSWGGYGWYDPDLLDGTVDGWNDGKSCPVLGGEPHELAATVNA